jgi:membrane protein
VRAWLKQPLWPILKKTWQGWSTHDGFLLSAAMAYYAAFSLLPLCLVLISALGLLTHFSVGVQNEQRELLAMVQKNVSPWLAEQLGHILEGVRVQAGIGGPLGLLLLLAAAVGIFSQLESIFDHIWGTNTASRGWLAAVRDVLYSRLIAFLMLLAVGALLILVFLADMVLSGVRGHVERLPGGHVAWHAGQSILVVAAYSLLLATIYKVLPRVRVRWRAALGGGLFVAVIWEIGQQILARFVIGENYSAYGVVGSFIAIMLWIYYASAVIFLGAEFVRAMDDGSTLLLR